MEDTVEKKVDGLADQIIAEDAERRAQDLVSTHNIDLAYTILRKLISDVRTYSTLLQNAPTGTLSEICNKSLRSSNDKRRWPYIRSFVRTPSFVATPIFMCPDISLGQRLAAEKGQSDDLVGAMKAQENAQQLDDSDEED